MCLSWAALGKDNGHLEKKSKVMKLLGPITGAWLGVGGCVEWCGVVLHPALPRMADGWWRLHRGDLDAETAAPAVTRCKVSVAGPRQPPPRHPTFSQFPGQEAMAGRRGKGSRAPSVQRTAARWRAPRARAAPCPRATGGTRVLAASSERCAGGGQPPVRRALTANLPVKLDQEQQV